MKLPATAKSDIIAVAGNMLFGDKIKHNGMRIHADGSKS